MVDEVVEVGTPYCIKVGCEMVKTIEWLMRLRIYEKMVIEEKNFLCVWTNWLMISFTSVRMVL